jgi:hypothetical protein
MIYETNATVSLTKVSGTGCFVDANFWREAPAYFGAY